MTNPVDALWAAKPTIVLSRAERARDRALTKALLLLVYVDVAFAAGVAGASWMGWLK